MTRPIGNVRLKAARQHAGYGSQQALADALHNLRTLERIEQQSDGEQQREAARTALEKVQTLAPRIERLKSGDDAT